MWPDQYDYLQQHKEISASALMRAAIDAHRGYTSPFETARFAADQEASLAVRARLQDIEAKRPVEIEQLRGAFQRYRQGCPRAEHEHARNWVEARRSAYPTLAHDAPDELLTELEREGP